MQSSLSRDIREWLARYLAGEISLHEFDNWFASATWTSDETADHETRELAHTIEHQLAEYTDGYWTEDELKRMLAPLVEHYTVTVGPVRQVSSSMSQTIKYAAVIQHSSAAGQDAAVSA
jgi:hypothetical protein